MFTPIVTTKGYRLIYAPDHAYANYQGYVPEHRLVIEKNIGRLVNPMIEDVHHIDENRLNNKLSNLILLTKSEHRRTHAGWRRIDNAWWKTCTACNRFLVVEGNFYKRHKGHNEFVTQCKQCIRAIAIKQHRRAYIICAVCKRRKLVWNTRVKNCLSCRAVTAWKTRRQRELAFAKITK